MKRYTIISAAALVAILAVAFLVTEPASAEIYRWVDENGVTHFSDRKPTGTDSGKEEVVDPSQTGTLTIIEGAGAAPTYTPRMEAEPDKEGEQELNRNARVVIYTVDT